MPSTEIAILLRLLRDAVENPAVLPAAIGKLNAVVWNSDGWEAELSADAVEALGDLATELEYYEPNVAWRAQEQALFGEEEAAKEIAAALTRIGPGTAG